MILSKKDIKAMREEASIANNSLNQALDFIEKCLSLLKDVDTYYGGDRNSPVSMRLQTFMDKWEEVKFCTCKDFDGHVTCPVHI